MSASASTVGAARNPVALAFPHTQALDASFDACREVARSRARNFYYGLKLTPEPRRSAVYAIYAWMRLGDDIADAPQAPGDKARAFARFRESTHALLAWRDAGAASDPPRTADPSPMWPAFAETLRAFPVATSDVRAMLAGLDDDLAHEGCASADDLERYCALVASSVGRVCVSIWGVKRAADEAEALRLADRRGIAFQLTNILRDFSQDHAEGRVYLPRESFDAHRLSPESLRRWDPPHACEALIRHWAARARAAYNDSAPLVDMIDPACAPTLWAMTTIYSGLLERIEADPACIVGPRRVRLASHRKAAIALKAAMMLRRERM